MNIKECSNTLTLIKFNIDDCMESKKCATCWNEVEDYMKFREREI